MMTPFDALLDECLWVHQVFAAQIARVGIDKRLEVTRRDTKVVLWLD